jgi:threonine/homoserine/homoserine lactone efflux protein
MTPHLASLILFSLTGAITPGPNNIMIMTSGVNFGLRASVPHIAGVWLGATLLQLMIGGGFYGLLAAFPWLHTALFFVSLLYLLYLAWKIASATSIAPGQAAPRPFTLLQAAAFQWVNPKAWALGLAAMTMYTRPGHMSTDVAAVALAISTTTVPCLVIWASAGTMLRQALSTRTAVRFFNVIMAILLVLSLLPVLLSKRIVP